MHFKMAFNNLQNNYKLFCIHYKQGEFILLTGKGMRKETFVFILNFVSLIQQ